LVSKVRCRDISSGSWSHVDVIQNLCRNFHYKQDIYKHKV
jgi:hypothetical protein